MTSWTDVYVPKAIDAWHTMTLMDYAHVTIAVVLIGWAVSRLK